MLTERTKVFISYSHQDRAWLERLRIHLRPLESDFKIDIWDDSRIKPGSNWQEEIRTAIKFSKVAILLISADFLASDFIATNELPPLLNAAKEDGATILPVILSPSRFTRTKGLSQFQTVNPLSSPLIDLKRSEQESIFVTVSECIEEVLTSSQHPEAVGSAAQTLQQSDLLERTSKEVQTDELGEKHFSNPDRLEATVSNPNYKSDLRALEDKWDIAQVISPKTIIIVTGSNIICELLDRPVAESIRDEIDRQGNISIGRRGIIVGDLGWLEDDGLQSHHVISIGGPSINQVTQQIKSEGNTRNYSVDMHMAFLDSRFLRVALWGKTAAHTKQSVEFYIKDSHGLLRLLHTCWK